MTWEAWATIGTCILILLALARNVAGPDVIFLGGMAVLMTLGLIPGSKLPGPTDMARLFGNEGLLTVGVLYVVAAGLTETGGLGRITAGILGRPRRIAEAQIRMMLPVTAISSFLNNTPVVAMFMPVIGDWCRRNRLSPSKFYLPLSYAAIFGGSCTLIGTSTNLVLAGLMIQSRATDPAMPLLGMWDVGAVGVPAAIAGTVFVILFSRRLLPERKPATENLADPRQYTVEMMVEAGSPIDGRSIEDAGLRHLPGMYLVEIQRKAKTLAAVGPDQVLEGDDRLIFAGVVESVKDLQKVRGLVPATDQVFKLHHPRHDRCLVEAVVSNTCPLVGKTVRDGRFRTRYDAAVIAVHRNGHRIDRKIGDIQLHTGDALLLETHPRFLETHRNNRDFFLVSEVADSQPRRHEKAGWALAILAAMVAAMALESFTRVSIFHIGLVAAGLMVLLGCCSVEQARKSIDWATLVAIGASFGIGKAMESSGAADAIAGAVMSLFQHPIFESVKAHAVLAGLYLITLIFTELVTNNAAVVLAFPIAHTAALQLGASFMPFAIAIAVASSAGFAVPTGYATHLMVHGPGGYRFGDWTRMGIPLDILFMGITVLVAPLVFPF